MKKIVLPKYSDLVLTSSLLLMTAIICFSYIQQPKMDEIIREDVQIVSDANVEIKKINAIKSTLNKLMDFDHESIDTQTEKNIYPVESIEKKFLVKADEIKINKEPTAKVNLIIEDLQNSKALINGKFYSLGDKIESGEEVMQITYNTVFLKNASKKIYKIKINSVNLQQMPNN